MKLLIVNTAPSRRNGITNVIFNLLNSMERSNMEIGYVSVTNIFPEYQAMLDNMGIKVYHIPRTLSRPLSYIRALKKAARGYDVIHVHGNSATLVLEMIAAKLAGVPVRLAHSHNTSCSHMSIHRLCKPLFSHLNNARLACGEAAGKWLYGSKDFTVINNGINTGKYKFNIENRQFIRNQLRVKDSTKLIGNIGFFVEAKNHRFLIDLFSEINKKDPDTRLVLLGAGPLMEESKAQAKSLGIEDKVIFTNSVPDPEKYLSALDMIIMPSIHEGFPLTLVEEQANGLYILASDNITDKADLTGNITFMSLDESKEKWADTALDILSKSDEHNKSKSQAAIDDIKKAGFDISVAARQVKQFYIEEYKRLIRNE